jgi:type IV pilus biogenesis/stability protein PilW
MDAIKKAQLFRLRESKEIPFFKEPVLKNQRKTGLKNFWIFGGAGVGIVLSLFFLGSNFSPSLIFRQSQKVVLSKKEKSSAEPVINFPKPAKEEAPAIQKENPLPSIKPSMEKKRERPPIKRMAKEKKINKGKPYVEKVTEKRLPATPPPSVKEEARPQSIRVEQEGGRSRAVISDVLTHFNLGIHFYNQRETLKAIQAYQKVIELDPNYVEAYNNLGVIYQKIGDFDRAFEAYHRSIEINPRYEKAHNNLGILLYLNGRYEEAREAFQKALAINSNSIESYLNLGILYKKQGQTEKAMASYQKALAINPFHGESHYNIGLLYEDLKNFELAINHYQNFIQLSAKNHPGLVAQVQRHLDYLMKAIKDKRRERE